MKTFICYCPYQIKIIIICYIGRCNRFETDMDKFFNNVPQLQTQNSAKVPHPARPNPLSSKRYYNFSNLTSTSKTKISNKNDETVTTTPASDYIQKPVETWRRKKPRVGNPNKSKILTPIDSPYKPWDTDTQE